MITEIADHLDLAGRISLIPGRLPVREAVARIVARKASIRQERLSGIHNPWGHCIAFTDPWAFLELCESDLVIDAVRKVVGPDVILWDSELFAGPGSYADFLRQGREGRYWPVSPLAGAIVLLPVGRKTPRAKAIRLEEVGPKALDGFDAAEPLYVIRLMPATSRFDRDPKHAANLACMEEQVLVNYSNRPLWLLCGTDRANNDLVSGFAPAVPVWASGALPTEREEK
ncbi:resolvase [Phyllobacterium zundukense]|uniref:Resolvase n=1 Tax=Phyllobacterium zundukense TaxID=1867719 RepID=A0A2N9VT36_9HYPH|nr:resolvase [Phyllobacterium zundukense]ATU95432.1 resolvase [Phyllobacterium zundukense]PIO42654.1 resolvase [Phyllobacterium zundukense]